MTPLQKLISLLFDRPTKEDRKKVKEILKEMREESIPTDRTKNLS